MLELGLDPRLVRPGNRVDLLRDGAEAYPRMLEAIAGARQSILLEVYTFAGDETGRRFADALASRARAGVAVRVLYDSVGSFDSPDELFQALEEAGARVLEYHPIRPWARGFSLRRRDHRKLLVADGRVAFVGGLNIARAYDAPDRGGLGWHDAAVRIEGPVVWDLVEMFSRTWKKGLRATPLNRPPPIPPPVAGGMQAAALGAERWRGRRSIGRAFLRAIRTAERRVWVSNAYFVPAPRFVRALRGAAHRGVDVRVLVPAVTDVPGVRHASRALFGALLRRGVRIFEWEGPVLHAKTAVIDSRWCTVGSYNLDHMSMLHNLELTVLALGPALAARMERAFEEDLRRSREVSLADWKRRGWWRRFVEGFFYLFSPLL